MEDPWLGMSDHPNGILYGENSWGGENQPHSKLNSSCGGALVFIKIDHSLKKLSAKDFGFDSIDRHFKVTNKYVWSSEQFTLPIKIEFNFILYKTNSAEVEFAPYWSQNKNEWGKDCDGLSMYMATHRQDFTFRTGLFKSFPKTIRPHAGS